MRLLRLPPLLLVLAAAHAGSCEGPDRPRNLSPSLCPAAVTVPTCGECVAQHCNGEAAACFGPSWQEGSFDGECRQAASCACNEHRLDCDALVTPACRRCQDNFGRCTGNHCVQQCALSAGGPVGGPVGPPDAAVGGTGGFAGAGGISGFGGAGAGPKDAGPPPPCSPFGDPCSTSADCCFGGCVLGLCE